MSDINNVTLTGRIGNIYELRKSNSGTEVLSLSLCYSEYNRVEKKEIPLFFDVTLFGHNAKYISDYAVKGQQIAVSGSLSISSWTDKEGVSKSRTYIIGNNVSLGAKPGGKQNTTEESDEFLPVDEDDEDFDDMPF